MSQKKRILVAVLNWGLGHASRSSYLIQNLIDLGHEVIIASDGAALRLLRENFPKLPYFEFEELKVKYSGGAALGVIMQLPKLNAYIRREKRSLDTYLESNSIDLIISDNRYGVYSKKIPSVILTHQLKVKIPFGEAITTSLIKARTDYFKECWLPDDQKGTLAGELSASQLSIPKINIGGLSQFAMLKRNEIESPEEDNEILVILSGPEPSRSKFEKKLVKQASKEGLQLLIVKGKDEEQRSSANIRWMSFLNADELVPLIKSHSRIICRSGYSSIMDLCYLGRKALLIPTPKQPEQTYLANYHRDRQHFYSVREKDLDLKRDLKIAFGGEYEPPHCTFDKDALKNLLSERIEELT